MQKINKGIPALIMVRDIAPDAKNPFTTEQTVEMIEKYHAAKGHDVEPQSLNYREGDGFFASAKGRNNQNAVFLDSKGKAYTVACHSLPSARGQGEPLSGKINAESGETFAGVVSGTLESKVVLASSAGYGFVANLGDLQTKNKKEIVYALF